MVDELNDQTAITHERPRLAAPAGRAGDEELGQMVRAASDNPLLSAVLDWLDGFVLVLNEQRQILMADPDRARQYGIEDADSVLGRRPGEALDCVHSTVGEDGCGTADACAFCGALGAILESQQLRQPLYSECRLTIRGQDGPEKIRFEVRASQAQAGDWDVTVVVFRRAVERPITLDQPALDETWPHPTYTRVRKLGSGGMGDVHLVEDEDGHQYALKTLRRSRADDGIHQERFRRESQLSLALDHPNIVRTHAVDETPSGILYMVSEYCPGGSTSSWLQSHGPLPAELALRWMMDVARGLQYAWREHRVIHRDIKPDNLLLDAGLHVKIADLGIARRMDLDTRLTATGLVVGSLRYMSPEQARGKHGLDIRSDLYAVGATFYHLLCGAPPFDGPNPTEILLKQLKEAPAPIRQYRDDLPTSFTRCVYWLLNKLPKHRPAVPMELLKELVEIAGELDIDPDARGLGSHATAGAPQSP